MVNPSCVYGCGVPGLLAIRMWVALKSSHLLRHPKCDIEGCGILQPLADIGHGSRGTTDERAALPLGVPGL